MRIKVGPEPEQGQKRYIRRFLLLPLTLDEEFRWLEWSWIVQEYKILAKFEDHGVEPWPCWCDVHWYEREEVA